MGWPPARWGWARATLSYLIFGGTRSGIRRQSNKVVFREKASKTEAYCKVMADRTCAKLMFHQVSASSVVNS